MNRQERIAALCALGEQLQQKDDYREAVMARTAVHNPWLTVENQRLAIQAICDHFLQQPLLESWSAGYTVADEVEPERVGIVMAGNIPLVGFHDFLCTFISGHQSVVKCSEKDPWLFPLLVRQLIAIDARAEALVTMADRLNDVDAIVATGSNNTARYFEAYFGHKPHIIRRNRSGLAVLSGEESREDLLALGKDVFTYFGLGCRNVSSLWVPVGYDFTPLLEAMYEYREIVLHSKYKNNFDYHYASFLLNRQPFLANGCVMLLENPRIASPVATLHYQYYGQASELPERLRAAAADIQVVVSAMELLQGSHARPFGQAQQPQLADYADGIDTMAFLSSL